MKILVNYHLKLLIDNTIATTIIISHCSHCCLNYYTITPLLVENNLSTIFFLVLNTVVATITNPLLLSA